jgi:membrane-bound lytic murein transglycosylase D
MFLLVSVFYLGRGLDAEELVSYQLDGEELTVLGEKSLGRPVRQIHYAPSHAIAPHGEIPSIISIEGLDHPITQKCIAEYSSPGGRNFLATIMKRGEMYLGFIRKEIERRGMPAELIYLPVIESSYSYTAVSRVGATGLWQFMRVSMGAYDMKVSDWMDERRDFWKSTMGALDMLEYNYKALGNWEFALAAYNYGLGAVNNMRKKNPGASYWDLCEKKAINDYVPRLLAVSHILSNPRQFALELRWPEDPDWTRIKVGRSVDLGLVAEHAGIPAAELKKANGELFYGITPPDPNYYIKVPSSQAEAVAAVLDDPELTLIKYYFYTIHFGDTLSEIAQRYGISVNQVVSYNPGLRAQYLQIGQRIIIPALKDVTISDKARTDDNVSFTGTHLVKQGESLWSIALAYNTDPETLARVNSMGLNDPLPVGKVLKTPVR